MVSGTSPAKRVTAQVLSIETEKKTVERRCPHVGVLFGGPLDGAGSEAEWRAEAWRLERDGMFARRVQPSPGGQEKRGF